MERFTFDWDQNNENHLALHEVSRDEFEQMFEFPRLEMGRAERNGEQRIAVMGRTAAGRMVTAIYTVREGRVRAVTAYTTKRKHRKLYEQQTSETTD